MTVLLVGSGNRGDSDLYLTRALAIGDRPRFEASTVQADSLSAETLARARVVVLQDLPVGDALLARLKTFVEGGGGLIVALGPRAPGAPGRLAAGHGRQRRGSDPRRRGEVERLRLRTRRLRAVPRAAQRRLLDRPRVWIPPAHRAARRRDAGAVRRRDAGAWSRARSAGAACSCGRRPWTRRGTTWRSSRSTCRSCTSWCGRSSGYREQPGWVTVGQAIEMGAAGASTVVLSPGGQRVSPPEGGSALEVAEAGFLRRARCPRGGIAACSSRATST